MLQNVNASNLKGKVDVGIITIREDEYKAILDRFPTEQFVNGRQTYSVSTFQTTNGAEYVVASVRCPEQGNLQGATVSSELIEDLDPQLILLVGIAGAVPDDEYTLGDVILASRLHDFNISASIEDKRKQTSQQFASTGGPMHPLVQNIIGALPAISVHLEEWNTPETLTIPRPDAKVSFKNLYGEESWQKKVRQNINRYFGKKSVRQNPIVFAGSIASSDTLVKNTQLIEQWQENSRQIKGVEMELAGVYQAASRAQKPVLAIRGISDIVGFKRSSEWTGYACHSAASFTAAFLRFHPINPISTKEEIGDNEIKRESSAPVNKPVSVFQQPPPNFPPIRKHEALYSNLIEVTYFPETIYSVKTERKSGGEIWTALKEHLDPPPYDWVYKGKKIYAFHNFSEPIWKEVCDPETVDPRNTSEWSEAEDHIRKSEFIDLLSGCLKEVGIRRDLDYIHKPKVAGVKKSFKYLCFAPTSTFTESPLFQASDFQDIDSIVEHLKNKESELAQYLVKQLSPETLELISEYPKPPLDDLKNAFTVDFNKLLKSNLYNLSYFDEVYLRRQTTYLLEDELTEEEDTMQLNRMLLEDAYKNEIVKKCFSPRTLTVKSLYQSRPRDVFRAYHSEKTGKFKYYRHSAFRFQFMRIAGKWYMEITPTYHYTWDGYRVFNFYENEIKGIKKIEDNEAVFRQVLFWSRILKGNREDLMEQFEMNEDDNYTFLQFGNLLEFPFEYGVIDEAWRNRDTLKKIGKGGSRRGGRSRKVSELPKRQTNFFTE